MQVAGIKAVIEKRADIFPLFEPLRQACGDAICGPAMAIFHFGAVKDGFLVEAVFPVSGPVETEQVYTRMLEETRAWTRIHRGSHEKLRETTSALIEHARAHAGTLAGQREVYMVLDLDDPEQNMTEVQLVKHQWDRLLVEGVERNLEGNVLHMRKVPYGPEGYEQGATPVERRRAYCHCAFVRPYLDQVPSRMSPTFCWCGSGWYRRLWEGILDQPVKIEHVETLLNGNDGCTLTITLPLALEGETRPERASLGLS